MKKRTLKPIVCAAVMALTLSITACGGSDGGASSSTSDSATVEDTEGSAEVNNDESAEEADAAEETDAAEEANAGDDEYFETLEEAFADPDVKAAMDEEFNSMDLDGMEFSYEVTGNEFIANYKVLDTVIEDPDDFAEQMEPVMDSLGGVFSMIPEAFDEAIGKEGATSVTVRFLDANDTLLIERSYKAE